MVGWTEMSKIRDGHWLSATTAGLKLLQDQSVAQSLRRCLLRGLLRIYMLVPQSHSGRCSRGIHDISGYPILTSVPRPWVLLPLSSIHFSAKSRHPTLWSRMVANEARSVSV